MILPKHLQLLMFILSDYEEGDAACSNHANCPQIQGYSQYMSRELVSPLQDELSFLPVVQENGFTRHQIHKAVERVVNRVHREYQTSNGITLTGVDPAPVFGANDLLNGVLPNGFVQGATSINHKQIANGHPSSTFSEVPFLPWMGNVGDNVFLPQTIQGQYDHSFELDDEGSRDAQEDFQPEGNE